MAGTTANLAAAAAGQDPALLRALAEAVNATARAQPDDVLEFCGALLSSERPTHQAAQAEAAQAERAPTLPRAAVTKLEVAMSEAVSAALEQPTSAGLVRYIGQRLLAAAAAERGPDASVVTEVTKTAAARLQRWWRAFSLRRRWLETITSLR
eukprot:3036727-Prymnesium_polylepis.1